MELTDTKHSSMSKQYLEFQRTGWMDGWTDGWMDGWMDGNMDGYGFTGGHIFILKIDCFQKAASARYVTFVWIYTLYACQN